MILCSPGQRLARKPCSEDLARRGEAHLNQEERLQERNDKTHTYPHNITFLSGAIHRSLLFYISNTCLSKNTLLTQSSKPLPLFIY